MVETPSNIKHGAGLLLIKMCNVTAFLAPKTSKFKCKPHSNRVMWCPFFKPHNEHILDRFSLPCTMAAFTTRINEEFSHIIEKCVGVKTCNTSTKTL